MEKHTHLWGWNRAIEALQATDPKIEYFHYFLIFFSKKIGNKEGMKADSLCKISPPDKMLLVACDRV